MKVVQVPKVPKEAYNPNRPMSQLIEAQVKHFKHVEKKLPRGQRISIPVGKIRTEAEAAHYIGLMTGVLMARKETTVPIPGEGSGIALAASAEQGEPRPKTSGRAKAKKTVKPGAAKPKRKDGSGKP